MNLRGKRTTSLHEHRRTLSIVTRGRGHGAIVTSRLTELP